MPPGLLFVLIFSVPILGFVTQYVFKAYTAGSYYTRGRSFDTALMILVFLAVALLMKKRVLARDPKNIVLLNLYVYASILFILTLKHFIFQRVGLRFLPVATFLLPEMLYSIKPDESRYAQLQTLDKQQKNNSFRSLGHCARNCAGTCGLLYSDGAFYGRLFLLLYVSAVVQPLAARAVYDDFWGRRIKRADRLKATIFTMQMHGKMVLHYLWRHNRNKRRGPPRSTGEVLSSGFVPKTA